MLTWPHKDPQDRLPHGLRNWKAHIGDGDKVVSATCTVTPPGLTVAAEAIVTDDGDKTSVWIEGGDLDVTYVVTFRATLASGGQVDRSAKLRVTSR